MDNEQIPYLSSVRTTPVSTAPVQDEADYPTLKRVQQLIHDFNESLYNNFNAFDLSKEKGPDDLYIEVLAHQRAYELTVALQGLVDSAVDSVDEKGKE